MKTVFLACATIFFMASLYGSTYSEGKKKNPRKITKLKIVRVSDEEMDNKGALVRSPPLSRIKKNKSDSSLNLKEKTKKQNIEE